MLDRSNPLALSFLVLASCSAPVPEADAIVTEDHCEVETARQAIVGGNGAPRLLPLSAAETRAVVSVSLPPVAPDDDDALCTGVVVAPRAVLTARHCLDRDADGIWDQRASGERAPTLVVLGSPSDPAVPQGPPDDAWLHAELDVALLEIGWLDEAAIDVTPLLPNRADLDETWISAPLELAGYGTSEFVEPPALRFAIETVARVEPSHVIVDGMGRSGACVGDSGGPALGRADDGRIRVLGILDDGDPSCVGEDAYTRVDRLTDWEPMARLVSADDPTNAPCAGLTDVGVCERGRAMHCAAGRAIVELCETDGRVCGWDSSIDGFRCVARDDDACGGLGSHARCFGDTLTSCLDGELISEDCRDCERACVPWLDASGGGCEER